MKSECQRDYNIAAGKLLSVYLVLYAFNIASQSILSNSLLSHYATYIVALGFVLAFLFQMRRLNPAITELLVGELILSVLFLIMALQYEEYLNELFARCVWTFVFCVPLFAVFRKVSEISVAIDKTGVASIIVIGMMAFMALSLGYTNGKYNMPFGYTLLYPTLCCIWQTLRKKYYVIPAVVGCLLILLFGSRGASACVCAFIAAVFISIINKPKKYAVVLKVLVVVGLVAFIAFFNEILDFLSRFIESAGISSRTIKKLLEGEILYDNGRISLHKIAWAKALEKPLFGWGIAGDVVCMVNYPHLLFLELLLDYGFIAGGVACIVVAIRILCIVARKRLKDLSFILLICCGFFPLLMSHSYLQEPLFWVLLGTLFNSTFAKSSQKQVEQKINAE